MAKETRTQKLRRIIDSHEWLIAYRNLGVLEMVNNMLIKVPGMETGMPGRDVLKELKIRKRSLAETCGDSDSVWMTLAILTDKKIKPYCIRKHQGVVDKIYHRDGDVQVLDEEKWQTIEEHHLPYPP